MIRLMDRLMDVSNIVFVHSQRCLDMMTGSQGNTSVLCLDGIQASPRHVVISNDHRQEKVQKLVLALVIPSMCSSHDESTKSRCRYCGHEMHVVVTRRSASMSQ